MFDIYNCRSSLSMVRSLNYDCFSSALQHSSLGRAFFLLPAFPKPPEQCLCGSLAPTCFPLLSRAALATHLPHPLVLPAAAF